MIKSISTNDPNRAFRRTEPVNIPKKQEGSMIQIRWLPSAMIE